MPLVDHRAQALRRNPQELIRHMQSFDLDLKFSAGIWFFAPGGNRFHDRYVPDLDIESRLAKAASLKGLGLQALEAHYPNEINEHNLPLWQQFVRDTGIRILTAIPLLFFDAAFEFGSLSSPIAKVRATALERTKLTLALNKELNTDFAIVWPGIDGFDNAFGVDYYGLRDRFADGLAEALDTVPGVRIAFEPKPYEPRFHILYGTTAEGLLLGQKVESRLKNPANHALLAEGHGLVGMNPEVGHMMMATESLGYAFSLVTEYARLFHTHWNSQPLGNYDQDQNVGVIAPEETEAALYALKMAGYQGYFGIDINPERMPVEVALRNNFDALRAANDRINGMDHESVLFSTEHPDEARGWLEGYLIRQRAQHPERLSPLPSPVPGR
jgi:xylose isomerase